MNFTDSDGRIIAALTLAGYVYGPTILTTASIAAYRFAPYIPAIGDFIMGFFDPGPPPMTPAGVVGTGARKIYDETISDKGSDSKCQ